MTAQGSTRKGFVIHTRRTVSHGESIARAKQSTYDKYVRYTSISEIAELAPCTLVGVLIPGIQCERKKRRPLCENEMGAKGGLNLAIVPVIGGKRAAVGE